MYRSLWNLLPGPVWVRVLQLLILATLTIAALVLWVFPVIDQLTAPQEVIVEE